METQFFDLKVWSETRWKKNGSDVREQNFARKHARLGWVNPGLDSHWNVAPFASSSLSLLSSLSPLPLRYLSPSRRQVASRERRECTRRDTPPGRRARDNSKLLFLQTKRFYFADGRKYDGSGKCGFWVAR